ncbi:type II secretion system F family protein [Lachnospiraceae bacterium OttesenSCG-928-D06]|nr:type II secretion system F family protein [Lachnospiraceae bacterium OttesenSCG-928-D06]
MVKVSSYVIIVIYFIMFVFWVVLFLVGNKKNESIMIDKYLPRNKYPLRELIGVGLVILDCIHYSFESNNDMKRITQMKGVYGERWGVFYYKINVAERVAYGVTLMMVGLLIAPITGELLFILASPVLGVLGFILAMGRVTDVVKMREEEILKQFPNAVSNLALLINSGMDTFSAWETVALNNEGILFEEMQNTITDMKTQGTSEMQAYINFSSRCAIPRISKFISMMVQNIKKGSDDLIDFLIYESSVCWAEKKSSAKIQGEKAGNKLMIPIFMIMLGILILILGPLASSLSV